jgi:hypothetical protein
VSNGYYSAFHGFLMMFNVQMAALFLSLWWYLGLIDREREGWSLLGPYLLFGFALLAYEPMLFFAGLYYAVSVFRAIPSARVEWTWTALIPQTTASV